MIWISASKDGWNRMPAAFNLHMSFADRKARETRQMGMAVMCSKAVPPTKRTFVPQALAVTPLPHTHLHALQTA